MLGTAMLDRLRHFMADLAGEPEAREFGPDDYRLAAASLLVHLAHADGVIGDEEMSHLRNLIAQNFELDAQATTRLIQSAEKSDREAVDFYHFTNTLTRTLDQEGRLRIVEMMWEIAFADGSVHELEENIVARIADLLGVAPHDRVRLRQEAAVQRAAEVAFSGPWAQKLVGEKG
jgi:uncharacterized tellurite resistance protein B-like protein